MSGTGILSDGTLLQLCHDGDLITPWDVSRIQPSSYDVALDCVLVGGDKLNDYWLPHGQFVLGSTIERFHVPHSIRGNMQGKSTRAREALIVESAGYVDAGFEGTLTLELYNLGQLDYHLYHGMLIAQVEFAWLDVAAQRPYGSEALGSHYQGQTGPTLPFTLR